MSIDEIISYLRDAEQKRYDDEERITKRFKKTNSFMTTIAGGKRVDANDYANVMAYCRIKGIADYSPKPVTKSIHKAILAITSETDYRGKHLSPADYFNQSGFSACGMSHTFDTVISVIKREYERKLRIFARL